MEQRNPTLRSIAWLWFGIAVAVLLVAFRQAIFLTPRDAAQGDVGRIFYYHVPIAMWSLLFPYLNFAASLARVLQTDPELLLLDEPFSNLDAASASHMVELLADFRTWPVPGGGTRTILLTTHQAALAKPLADMILTMRNGQILEPEATAE